VSRRYLIVILKRAAKAMLDHNTLMFASALAYSSFLAIPAVALVAVGLFTLLAGPATIASLLDHLGRVMPAQATQLLGDSLNRLDHHPGTSITMTIGGTLLAIWSTTGAMTAYMTALNIAYGCKDSRSFLRKRTVALLMATCVAFAFLLLAVLLVFGPHIEHWVGSAIGAPGLTAYVWWIAQWPILVAGLLAAFATMLYLGPNMAPHSRRWQLITPGAVVAAGGWLAASGLFAVYTAKFGSYDKTWGSLSAVIVMLTWLWLSALALLFGAEINAQIRADQGRSSHPEPKRGRTGAVVSSHDSAPRRRVRGSIAPGSRYR